MTLRILILLYAIISYAVSIFAVLYAIGFVGNFIVPKTIDLGGAAPWGEALVDDIALLGLFAIQHSVMARPAFKRCWTGIIPERAERSTYVLFSSLVLLLLFWQWRPIPAAIWQTEGTAAALLGGLQALGWIVAFASTFMIDHFDLFGLRQGVEALRAIEPAAPGFQVRFLYRIVRHPLMLGFLIAFWATPVMTAGHLLFALMMTGYILAAIPFEERDLTAVLGESYEQYRRQVPMLVPFTAKRENRTPGASEANLTFESRLPRARTQMSDSKAPLES
jgi:protein-S-isoprenylcysteine O-methyltransferase Ste14